MKESAIISGFKNNVISFLASSKLIADVFYFKFSRN